MNIYSYIRRDHKSVALLMQKVVESSDPAERQSLFSQIKAELLLHLDSEEKTFYAAIEKASSAASVTEQMSHSHEEHDEVRTYLKTLDQTPVDVEEWIEQFGEFKHAVAHHVEEEETQVWEKARKYLSEDQAIQLAKDMDSLKKALKKERAPELERPTLAQ